VTVTLTNRLTLFSLVALGIVLAAFSGTTYVLARTYLMRQLNDRATATLDTLVAAAEVEGDGLEWERRNRQILLRGDGEPPAWAVYDEGGRRLDGSDTPARSLDGFVDAGVDAAQSRVNVTWDGDHWRVVRRTLRHPHPDEVRTTEARKRYRTLVFVTAWPVAPVHDLLRTLAWSLGIVSVALWVVAGLAGRWVCRRALAPVSRMTESVKRITAADLDERLPVPAARDELHDLAGSFNDLLARLRDSFERQQRFTGEASHQLRTPLTALIGQVEVALRRNRDEGEYRRVFTTVGGQAERLRQIVELLLFLSRADRETAIPDTRRIDLREWLPTHIRDTWSTHSRYGELQVLDKMDGPVWVDVQSILLGQAIDNLIDNALKYCPAGKQIKLEFRVDGADAIMQIADEGPGIPGGEADRIFEPFFRTISARTTGVAGVGLGLAVSARIVAAFAGTVRLVGRENNGCTIEIRIPLRAEIPG
jgi:signal transduction histidine kinase